MIVITMMKCYRQTGHTCFIRRRSIRLVDIKRDSAGHFRSPALCKLEAMLSGVNHSQRTKYDKDDSTS